MNGEPYTSPDSIEVWWPPAARQRRDRPREGTMNHVDRDRSEQPRTAAAGERIEPYQDALAWLRSELGGPPEWWHAAYAMVMAAADAEHASLRADRDRWKRLAFEYAMAAPTAESRTTLGREATLPSSWSGRP
ncbi:hypothetical protein LQK93_00982 [Terrabacter sp. BE26]